MASYGLTNLQLPYTYLVTKLRMSKRQCETEMAEILKEIINLKNSSDSKSKQEVLQLLRKSRQKIEELKQKLRLQKQQQDEIYNTCRKRVHLDKDSVTQPKEMTKEQILSEFDKEVLQFFACRNKIREAKMVQKSLPNNYQFGLCVKLYQIAFNISESITKNDLRPLKDWCYQHSHFLSKLNSSLEFKLISCGFINILNNKNTVKAIQFLRKQIATLSLSEQDKEELNKLTFTLLLAENQDQYEYYDDSDHEKELVKELENKLPKLELEAQKPQQKKQKQKKTKQNLNQIQIQVSSSSSVQEALNAAQQNMMSIFRALGEIAETAQGFIDAVINNTEVSNPPAIQPQNIEISQPDRREDILEIYYEEQYEQQFDSLSEEHEDEKNDIPRSLMKESMVKIKLKQSQIEQKPSIKQIARQVKRKNILDKNNLRALLNETKKQFLSAFEKIYLLSFKSYFDKTLAIGMAVMKTSACSESHSQQIGKQRQCPICTPDIQKIIKNIPGTLKNESSLICRINGSLMNEVNHPITLPNGQIYSVTGLQKTEKNGKYFCLAQKKWFRKQVCKKVFLT